MQSARREAFSEETDEKRKEKSLAMSVAVVFPMTCSPCPAPAVTAVMPVLLLTIMQLPRLRYDAATSLASPSELNDQTNSNVSSLPRVPSRISSAFLR
eukprot:762128-Hanusia_phi.AAC.2